MSRLVSRARTVAVAVYVAVVLLFPAARVARKAHARPRRTDRRRTVR